MVQYLSTIGDKYEGEWKECLKHGNGTDLFHSGDSYIGQYKFGTVINNLKESHVDMVNTFGVMKVCTQVNS